MEQWIDKVFHKDTIELLSELPDNSVDCSWNDPDYNVGIVYSGVSYTKDFNSYIEEYGKLAEESMRVLKDTGSAFFVNYPRNNAHLWVKFLENLAYDVVEYCWVYRTNVGQSPRRFTTAHRTILHAMKTKNSVFYKDHVAMPYVNQNDKRIRKLEQEGSKGRAPYSWFYADMVKNVTKSKFGIKHPCVIPPKLSSLLISSVTKEDDVVFISFAGSGSEIDVCRKLKRHFISADLSEFYCEEIERKLDQRYL